jgi:hypothetical protein
LQIQPPRARQWAKVPGTAAQTRISFLSNFSGGGQAAKAYGIPGQVAMEQVMACGLGPCYVCVRTFEVKGKKELRRVCNPVHAT